MMFDDELDERDRPLSLLERVVLALVATRRGRAHPTTRGADRRLSAETCRVTVNRGTYRGPHYEPCSRPAVENGMCSMHLKVEARRAQREAEWEARYARGQKLQDEATKLSAYLGVPIRAYYDPFRNKGEYTGDFVVPGDWLRGVYEERREEDLS